MRIQGSKRERDSEVIREIKEEICLIKRRIE